MDNELSNGNSWRESHEKDQTALRPRIQDISSSQAWVWQTFGQVAREYGVHPSLQSRWRDELAENDNAFAENFIKTLKVEVVYFNEYGAFEDAYENIWHFIEMVYSKRRLHSAL